MRLPGRLDATAIVTVPFIETGGAPPDLLADDLDLTGPIRVEVRTDVCIAHARWRDKPAGGGRPWPDTAETHGSSV